MSAMVCCSAALSMEYLVQGQETSNDGQFFQQEK